MQVRQFVPDEIAKTCDTCRHQKPWDNYLLPNITMCGATNPRHADGFQRNYGACKNGELWEARS